MTWTDPTPLADGFWDPDDYNRDVADNLDFLYDGVGLWAPGACQAIDANITVANQLVLLAPCYTTSTITVSQLGWRRDSAGGQVDVGIYTDDGNDETASVVTTSGLVASPSSSTRAEALSFVVPAVLERGIKYWLALGSTSNNNSISGTSGPLCTLARKATPAMPLPNIITFNSPHPTVCPALAALP